MDTDLVNVPNKSEHWIDRPLPRRMIPLMIAALVLSVLATHSIVRYGSISAALALAGGQRILVSPSLHSFGAVTAGETVSVVFTLRNEGTRMITIQGARGSCSCAVVDDLPCVIKPGASRSIGLKVVAPSDSERFEGTVSLYTDDRDAPVISLGYEGRVVKSVVAKVGWDGPN